MRGWLGGRCKTSERLEGRYKAGRYGSLEGIIKLNGKVGWEVTVRPDMGRLDGERL